MKQPVSAPVGQPELNRRPTRLETEQDLLRDQLNYFRASNQLPQHDQHLSSLSPSASQTPTSSCLDPIKEHVVSRSSRRRPRSKIRSSSRNSFPEVTSITNHAPSRFSRASRPSPTQQNDPNQHSISSTSITEQVRVEVASMSIEQIRAAQQEIHDTLNPESIQILKKMWLQRSQTSSHSQSPRSSTERSITTNPVTNPDQTNHEDYDLSFPSPLDRHQSCQVHSSRLQISDVQRLPSIDAHSELLVPVKTDESDEEERNKRVWMTDAGESIPSQRDVERLMEKALDSLGQVGKMRFGLDGAVLSPEEVQTLPTHLGLHHHGSSPASAGYTLPDILVLLRSTVVTQRIMAMKMLKSIVLRYQDEVVPPLIDSGALTSAFSSLPLDESFFAATTNRSAYLELVETFVVDDLLLEKQDSVNNLYFASNFYSPCPVKNCGAVIKALADSDVVTTLIGIARATAILPEDGSLAERSLRLVQLFVTRTPEAADKVLQKESSLLFLKTLTNISTESYPILFMLSCDILAQIVVSVGWRGGQGLEHLHIQVLDDRFIHKVSSKIVWLLDSDIEEISEEQSTVAKGVLRLIRGALTFQKGIQAFGALTPAVCRLVHSEVTVTETYLALEAYSHALFVQANSQADVEPDKGSSENVRRDEQYDHVDRLITRQLSDLIPSAISATTFFVDPNVHSEESRAAAGHFAATLFALTSHPIVEEYVVRVLKVSSLSAIELTNIAAVSPKSPQRIQMLASLSHAAARLLSKVRLDEGFVEREVNVFFKTLNEGTEERENSSSASLTRIVANACAEWIGLYASVGSPKCTAQFALRLLPRLSDARVIVDLLSRTLLNVGVLQGLGPTILDTTAEKCSKDLLPLVMKELSSLQQSQGERRSASSLMSFEDLCNFCIANEDVFDSLLCILTLFFETGLVEVTPLFECLLRTPVPRYSDSVFEILFKVAQTCVCRGAPLIDSLDKTKLSSLSTTVNAPLVDSILSLCDFLLSRGPTPTVSMKNDKPDFLSSVLMTLICGPDIDTTLRAAMWKRTVDDCGGATLYQNAVILEVENGSAKVRPCLELYDMLRPVGVSISEGYLDGEKCPVALRNSIFAQIETALSSGRTTHDVFGEMASSVRNRSSLSKRLVKLMTTSPLTTTGKDGYLSAFLDLVRVQS